MSDKKSVRSMSLSREALSGTVAKVVMTVVGFVGTIIFARVLGPTGFGGFSLLITIATLSLRPLIGWSQAAKKRFSEDTTERKRSEIVGSQFLFAGVVLVCLLFVILPLSTRLVDYVGVERAPMLLIILSAAMGLQSSLDLTAQGRGRIGASIWISTLQKIVAVPLQIALVLTGLGVAGMVFGHVVALVVAAVVLLYLAQSLPSIPTRDTFENLWEYARYSIPNAFFGSIYGHFDILLLGAILTPAAVGYYEAAFRLSAPALFVSKVASSAVHTSVSNLTSRGESPIEDISNTMSYTSILAFPLVFGAIAVSEDIITVIYGNDFAPAAALLVGLAVYQLIKSHTEVLISVAGGLDRPDVVTKLSVAALATNIILGTLLTIEIGAIGVVISTVVAESIRYVGVLHFIRGQLSLTKLYSRPMLEQLGSAILMFVVVMGLLEFVPASSARNIFGIISIGGITYFGTLFVVSKDHRTTAISSLRSI